MVVSSLLMYRVPASRKVEKPSSDGKDKKVALTWEFRYGFVLHNYLTGWFLIDLLSVTERLTLTVTLTATVTVTVTLTLTLTLALTLTTKCIVITLLYSAALPICYLFCAVFLWVSMWIDRYNLLRRLVPPPRSPDALISLLLRVIFPLAISLHLLG